jgi:hypothetical protein
VLTTGMLSRVLAMLDGVLAKVDESRRVASKCAKSRERRCELPRSAATAMLAAKSLELPERRARSSRARRLVPRRRRSFPYNFSSSSRSSCRRRRASCGRIDRRGCFIATVLQ